MSKTTFEKLGIPYEERDGIFYPVLVAGTEKADIEAGKYEQEVFDVYQIFDFERYLSEPHERVELHYKLIQQVVKYHKQLELWKKEIESLLPQKGQSAAIDKRILELDSKLEKSIDGHAAISDEVKNDLKSNKLDELIDKIDLLLKED